MCRATTVGPGVFFSLMEKGSPLLCEFHWQPVVLLISATRMVLRQTMSGAVHSGPCCNFCDVPLHQGCILITPPILQAMYDSPFLAIVLCSSQRSHILSVKIHVLSSLSSFTSILSFAWSMLFPFLIARVSSNLSGLSFSKTVNKKSLIYFFLP